MALSKHFGEGPAFGVLSIPVQFLLESRQGHIPEIDFKKDMALPLVYFDAKVRVRFHDNGRPKTGLTNGYLEFVQALGLAEPFLQPPISLAMESDSKVQNSKGMLDQEWPFGCTAMPRDFICGQVQGPSKVASGGFARRVDGLVARKSVDPFDPSKPPCSDEVGKALIAASHRAKEPKSQ